MTSRDFVFISGSADIPARIGVTMARQPIHHRASEFAKHFESPLKELTRIFTAIVGEVLLFWFGNTGRWKATVKAAEAFNAFESAFVAAAAGMAFKLSGARSVQLRRFSVWIQVRVVAWSCSPDQLKSLACVAREGGLAFEAFPLLVTSTDVVVTYRCS